MGEDTLNMSEAWIAYDTLIRYWGGLILPEPPDMDETFRRLTNRDEVSPNYWADAYLSAFAKGHGLTLVTFDRALAGKVKESILLGPSSRV
jgi:predicted nucleic acid-binding protein